MLDDNQLRHELGNLSLKEQVKFMKLLETFNHKGGSSSNSKVNRALEVSKYNNPQKGGGLFSGIQNMFGGVTNNMNNLKDMVTPTFLKEINQELKDEKIAEENKNNEDKLEENNENKLEERVGKLEQSINLLNNTINNINKEEKINDNNNIENTNNVVSLKGGGKKKKKQKKYKRKSSKSKKSTKRKSTKRKSTKRKSSNKTK